MRHVVWFVIGLVITLAGLVLAAIGIGRAVDGNRLVEDGLGVPGLVLLLVAGLFLGVLAASRRFSPAAPLAGGLGLLALGIAGWVLTGGFIRIPVDAVDDGLQVLLQTGVLLLVGALLTVLGVVPLGHREPRGRDKDRRPDDGFTAVPYAAPQAWGSTSSTQSWTPPER